MIFKNFQTLKYHLFYTSVQNNKETDTFAFIVDGKTLGYVFKYKFENEFRDVCMGCDAVLCCRMSPAQKAEVKAQDFNKLIIWTKI